MLKENAEGIAHGFTDCRALVGMGMQMDATAGLCSDRRKRKDAHGKDLEHKGSDRGDARRPRGGGLAARDVSEAT